jgi:hypothetical protein
MANGIYLDRNSIGITFYRESFVNMALYSGLTLDHPSLVIEKNLIWIVFDFENKNKYKSQKNNKGSNVLL